MIVSFSFHDLCFLMINEGSTNTYKLSNFACRGQKKSPTVCQIQTREPKSHCQHGAQRYNLNRNFHLWISSDNFNFRNMLFCFSQIYCHLCHLVKSKTSGLSYYETLFSVLVPKMLSYLDCFKSVILVNTVNIRLSIFKQ